MLSRITGPSHRGYNGGSEESGNEDGLHSGRAGCLPHSCCVLMLLYDERTSVSPIGRRHKRDWPENGSISTQHPTGSK